MKRVKVVRWALGMLGRLCLLFYARQKLFWAHILDQKLFVVQSSVTDVLWELILEGWCVQDREISFLSYDDIQLSGSYKSSANIPGR